MRDRRTSFRGRRVARGCRNRVHSPDRLSGWCSSHDCVGHRFSSSGTAIAADPPSPASPSAPVPLQPSPPTHQRSHRTSVYIQSPHDRTTNPTNQPNQGHRPNPDKPGLNRAQLEKIRKLRDSTRKNQTNLDKIGHSGTQNPAKQRKSEPNPRNFARSNPPYASINPQTAPAGSRITQNRPSPISRGPSTISPPSSVTRSTLESRSSTLM